MCSYLKHCFQEEKEEALLECEFEIISFSIAIELFNIFPFLLLLTNQKEW